MNPEEFNILPPEGFARLLEELRNPDMVPEQGQGECIERDVWVPVIHPMSGERVNMRAIAHDHIILEEQAQELEAMLEGEAHNTPDDYYDGKD